MRSIWLAGAVAASALALSSAAPALAAPTTITTTGGKLNVVGDGSGETYSVDADFTVTPTKYTVSGPAGFSAPAGCSSTATSVTCPSPTVSGITLDTAGGTDTIDEKSKYPIVFLFFGGGSGPVTATGGAGDDTLNAVNTPLTFAETGGADNDTLNGLGSVADFFKNEPGDDTYHGDVAAPPSTLTFGFPFGLLPTEDVYRVSGSVGVNVSLDGVKNDTDGMGGTDNVGADIDSVGGTDAPDTLSAGAHDASLFGAKGNDTLTGGAGDDSLFAGTGDDIVSGGDGDDTIDDGDLQSSYVDTAMTLPPPGNDTVDGGAGDDVVYESVGRDDVHGGAGEDTVVAGRFHQQVVNTSAPGFTPPPDQFDPMTISLDDQANDGVTGGSEGDNLHADVEDLDMTTDSQEGTIASDDSVTGSSAANRIVTGGGSDTVDPGAGPDDVDTGSQDDHVTVLDRTADRVACGRGTDTASVDLPGADPANADALDGCENVTGTPLPPQHMGLSPTGPATHVPRVTLSGPTTVKTSVFLKRRLLTVRVAADQAYSAAGEAVEAGARIARVGELTIGAGSLKRGSGKRTLKVKIARRYTKQLARRLRTKRQRRKGVVIKVVVTVTGAGGRATKASRAIRVKG
jgi:Ca2+-binding RTX toxin-like protein